MGTELFPDPNAPLLRIRLRAPTGTRVEGTRAYGAARVGCGESGDRQGQCQITSDYVGVVPSSYPVNLIYLFTSGPQEADALIWHLRPKASVGEDLQERLRGRFRTELPNDAFCLKRRIS